MAEWIKLDYDWYSNEKVIRYRNKYGKAALVDLINAYVLLAKCKGCVDIADDAHMEIAKVTLGKTKKGVVDIFDHMAEVGIIDATFWEDFGKATSTRSVADQIKRESRKASALAASQAAAEKRRAANKS